MCDLIRKFTYENTIKEFQLKVDEHQGKPNEYTSYSRNAAYDQSDAANSGDKQTYFYRAMGLKEFLAFRFGNVDKVLGHQGFASYRAYSNNYIKTKFSEFGDFSFLMEVYAPSFISEMKKQGWVEPKNEKDDRSWGIGTNQSVGWKPGDDVIPKVKNKATHPADIFSSTQRTYKVVNMYVKAKTKAEAALGAIPGDAPWHAFFKNIKVDSLESKDIRLLKEHTKALPLLSESESADENGIPNDGNCLFHSLARHLQVRGIKKVSHMDLRNYVCKYMDVQEEFCGKWGITPAYITSMRLPGTWGGGTEIAIIALIYNITIQVNVMHQGFTNSIVFNPEGGRGPAVEIDYRNGNHYTTARI